MKILAVGAAIAVLLCAATPARAACETAYHGLNYSCVSEMIEDLSRQNAEQNGRISQLEERNGELQNELSALQDKFAVLIEDYEALDKTVWPEAAVIATLRNAAPPPGWRVCEGMNDRRFLRGSTTPGGQGGEATQSHRIIAAGSANGVAVVGSMGGPNSVVIETEEKALAPLYTDVVFLCRE